MNLYCVSYPTVNDKARADEWYWEFRRANNMARTFYNMTGVVATVDRFSIPWTKDAVVALLNVRTKRV